MGVKRLLAACTSLLCVCSLSACAFGGTAPISTTVPTNGTQAPLQVVEQTVTTKATSNTVTGTTTGITAGENITSSTTNKSSSGGKQVTTTVASTHASGTTRSDGGRQPETNENTVLAGDATADPKVTVITTTEPQQQVPDVTEPTELEPMDLKVYDESVFRAWEFKEKGIESTCKSLGDVSIAQSADTLTFTIKNNPCEISFYMIKEGEAGRTELELLDDGNGAKVTNCVFYPGEHAEVIVLGELDGKYVYNLYYVDRTQMTKELISFDSYPLKELQLDFNCLALNPDGTPSKKNEKRKERTYTMLFDYKTYKINHKEPTVNSKGEPVEPNPKHEGIFRSLLSKYGNGEYACQSVYIVSDKKAGFKEKKNVALTVKCGDDEKHVQLFRVEEDGWKRIALKGNKIGSRNSMYCNVEGHYVYMIKIS